MDAQRITTTTALPVIERVVVGFDRSPAARAALLVGAGIGRTLGARVLVIEAWQYPATTMIPGGATRLADRRAVDAEVTEELEHTVADVLGGDARHVECTVERGRAAAALVRHSHGPGALVVLGSRELSGSDRVLLGSTTHDVLHGTTAPVLVVPDDLTVSAGMGRIVVGVDGTPGSQEAVLLAAGIAVGAGSTVVAVHATDRAREGRGDRVDHAAWAWEHLSGSWTVAMSEHGVDMRPVVTDAEPRAALAAIADDEDADLIVVGRSRRSLGPPWHVGSVAAFLSRHAGRPVLIAPPSL